MMKTVSILRVTTMSTAGLIITFGIAVGLMA